MATLAVSGSEAQNTRPLGVGPAPAQKCGSAVRKVTEIQRCAPGWAALWVSSFDGNVETVQIPGMPSASALIDELPLGCRPLAVRFELHSDGTLCTGVVSTGTGPRRVCLSIPAALALVERGVHGIVTRPPQVLNHVARGER